MNAFGIAALAAAVLSAGAASAAPIDDVGPWVATFQAAIAADRFDDMATQIKAVAAPGVPIGQLETTIADLAKRVDNNPVDLAEVFDERKLGTVFRKVFIAAHYKKGYFFYAVTFGRDSKGWQLFQFSYDPDVNKILASEWPT